jgi:hypothetical protein
MPKLRACYSPCSVFFSWPTDEAVPRVSHCRLHLQARNRVGLDHGVRLRPDAVESVPAPAPRDDVPPKGPRLIKSRLRRLPIPSTASFFALASHSRVSSSATGDLHC